MRPGHIVPAGKILEALPPRVTKHLQHKIRERHTSVSQFSFTAFDKTRRLQCGGIQPPQPIAELIAEDLRLLVYAQFHRVAFEIGDSKLASQWPGFNRVMKSQVSRQLLGARVPLLDVFKRTRLRACMGISTGQQRDHEMAHAAGDRCQVTHRLSPHRAPDGLDGQGIS